MNKEVWCNGIVVDIGIHGGWAVKALSNKGLKTVVMVQRDMVKPFKTYPIDYSKNTKTPVVGRIMNFQNKI